MHNSRTLSLLIAAICLAASVSDCMEAQHANSSTTAFLKWERKLSPRLLGSYWRTGAGDLDDVLASFALHQIRPAIQQELKSDPVGLKRVLQLDVVNPDDLPALLNKLRALPGTVYAEPLPERQTCDWPGKPALRETCEVPGDPLYGEQWFYPIMQAPSAWDLTHSDASVVVAIVDNGTDWQHPDLSDNIWTNPGEIAGDGMDNDQNGYVDDIRGWDFYDWDNDPAPEVYGENLDYHGTHTAGLVSALMNNGRGVVGMAPSCRVMPIRTGFGSTINYGLEGIVYAAHNGADIISLSWGGSYSNSYEQDVINDARAQGCLVVAAAGNENSSTPHYPAAYNGVMSVAATDPNDSKVGFSNYGSWISVCAPGLSILSLTPGGYGTADGSSMSTPLVAGVAALVKSYHPTWTAQQIFAQILYTADDISAKNPLYPGMLGSGRVNAYRALAETAPGIEIDNYSIVELSGDFDGKLDPGETASIIVTLQNYGSATADVVVHCASSGWEITVQAGIWSISQIPSGGSVDNAGEPFQVTVSPLAQINNPVSLIFTVDAEGFYTTSFSVPIWISPAFADHDTGSVVFTVTNFGVFGFQNYLDPGAPYAGSGFRFPKDESNALYHGSLMAGVSFGKVSDCIYGGSYYYDARYDWQTTVNGDISIVPGTVADQEGMATYKDTGAPPGERVGLAVTQHSYAWSNPPDDDFVIVAFELKNLSGQPLSNLYVGLYLDWDLIFHYNNEANWDAERSLGYVYNEFTCDPNRRYYGTSLLSGTLKSYRVIDNYADIPVSGVMTDSLKYAFLSAGMVKTASSTPSDQATLLSAGPFSLGIADSVEVAFAVLGGNTLADLQSSADAAQAAWNGMVGKNGPGQPTAPVFTIENVFPKPANGSLTLAFSVPGPGEVSFSLVDVLGRSTPLWKGYYAAPGSYRLAITDRELSSGVYWLLGSTSGGKSITKIIWLK